MRMQYLTGARTPGLFAVEMWKKSSAARRDATFSRASYLIQAQLLSSTFYTSEYFIGLHAIQQLGH